MNFSANTFYSIILFCSFFSMFLWLKITPPTQFKKHSPKITYTLTAILIILALVSFFYPMLISLLGRNTDLIEKGEVWRLLTSLFVQDGGIPGTIFNIVSLVLIGSLAEQYWKRSEWLLLFFGGGILANFIALAWQPTGAGNSIANFSLAGSLLIVSLLFAKNIFVRFLSFVGIVSAIFLVVLQDIHGASVGYGMIGGLLLLWNAQKESRYFTGV